MLHYNPIIVRVYTKTDRGAATVRYTLHVIPTSIYLRPFVYPQEEQEILGPYLSNYRTLPSRLRPCFRDGIIFHAGLSMLSVVSIYLFSSLCRLLAVLIRSAVLEMRCCSQVLFVKVI